MARNEDGEFELMLGNKQLLSVFFLMVLLLALCFVGGYWLGRSSAPLATAENQPVSTPLPASNPEPVVSTTTSAPERTTPQVAEKAPEPEAKASEPAKPEPAKEVAKPAPKVEAKAKTAAPKQAPPAPKQAATKAKQAPATGQPVSGRTYLQLSATDKDKADVMVDLLRRKNFSAIAAPVDGRPGMFRVLVGPVADNAIPQTKTQLKAGGFPADDAIRRVF